MIDCRPQTRRAGEEPMKVIFIQVKCEPGQAYDVASRIMDDVEEVGELYSTSGKYDLMVKFHLDDDTDIGHFVTERVQKVPGIKDTFTTMTFKAF
jgi:DNA-binding Lrp family transcriptional regulator